MIDLAVAFHVMRPYRAARHLLASVLQGNRVRVRGEGNSVQILSNPWDLWRLAIEIRGDNNRVEIRSRCRIFSLSIRMIGSGHCLRIEEECYITDGWLRFEDWQGHLTIGRGTSIRQAFMAVTEPGSSIRIGHDCMLADDIDISTGDSHSIL